MVSVGFAAYWFRATLRSRWRGYLGIVVLLGITGGLSLFALAGARRTQSAYPRFLRDANVSTMAVDTGQYDPETVATIASLPEVERSSVYVAPLVARIAHGKPVFNETIEALASLDGRFFDQDRFTPTQGRLPNPKRIDEVAVNEVAGRAIRLPASARRSSSARGTRPTSARTSSRTRLPRSSA